ncbi:LysR substrate-binding domain-containing protein [Acinetobacter rudis]|uniref:HTH lysR-type domain-containing protein n=1 Tax=Acinetobacter rudis CIP 110305 TaxID=421052 RepID=S3NZG2_9GAMM|nr:LysR substrate-binding domain-containing protein [Acinetobacter rudis]EPF71991.1 hypothetical protein F945_02337 [Acinetobacter rudis CIP 110305]
MPNFDDYLYFYLVVKYAGFSAASEASNISKSKLSRRVIALENHYKIKLIHRSTRQFNITALGQQFYEQCCRIIQHAEHADHILLNQKNELEGLIKVSCPPMMLSFQLRHLFTQFLNRYPKVEIEFEISSERIDIIKDNVDLAIRTNFSSTKDSNLIVRDVIQTTHCLVASPDLLRDQTLQSLTDLQNFPSIALGTQTHEYQWHLTHAHSQESTIIPLQPRIKSSDILGVYYAAKDGLGIADLPYLIAEADIQSGKLIHLFPEWYSNIGTVQMVYASRKEQRLLMAKLIDHLVEGLEAMAKTHSGFIH